MGNIKALSVTAAERAEATQNARLMKQATYAAVSVAVVLIAAKALAVYMTGSVAMLGTLLDSLLDGAASLLNLVAIRHALAPADDEHRFGHGKAEALAGMGQSIFICASAGFIGYESITRFFNPTPIGNSLPGIIVTAAAIAITLALVAFQRHVVNRTGSLAIEADSIHYRGDLLMNLSALAAIFLSGTLGLHWADPLGGILIAGLIAFSAVQIALAAYDQLMDRELTDAERERIAAIVLSHPEVVGIHDLRTRTSGTRAFIQCHLELDPAISLMKAHLISDEVEARILEAFPEAEVIIHQDPAGIEDVAPSERV